MEKIICPSMMCAAFEHLEKEVRELDTAGIDIFHIDVMDGTFVPNFGMGLQDFQLIRKSTNKLVDVHLMIQNPSNYIEYFADLGADIIYFHPEADSNSTRTIDKIHGKNKKAGIAINPGTSVETIQELLPLVEYVMVMTVNPGFAGQKYLDFVDGKIDRLLKLKKDFDFEIMVDGAISPEIIERLSQKGVAGFILGTSSLFGKKETYTTIVKSLREAVGEPKED